MIPDTDRVRSAPLGYVLLGAMGFATLTGGILGILGPFLLDDLGISRASLGWLASANTMSGAIISVAVGRLTDRIGAYGATILLGIGAAVSLALYAAAGSYLLLAVGAVIGGFAQALSNPATNKLIALHVPTGRRGIVTGVKQSGVFAMITIAGIAVPQGDLVVGWRVAVALFAAAAVGYVVSAMVILPDDRAILPPIHRERSSGPLDPAVWWLTGYGFLNGLVASFAFLFPLYATEALGRSEQFAGAVVSVAALSAAVGRVVWARFAETTLGYSTPLLAMAAGGALASWMILIAEGGQLWLAVVGGALFGASANAWNAVGMLAVTNLAGSADAGRSTGVVLTGFLAGLGVGPPALGIMLDRTGSYTLAWGATIAVLLVSIPLVLVWKRSERRVKADV